VCSLLALSSFQQRPSHQLTDFPTDSPLALIAHQLSSCPFNYIRIRNLSSAICMKQGSGCDELGPFPAPTSQSALPSQLLCVLECINPFPCSYGYGCTMFKLPFIAFILCSCSLLCATFFATLSQHTRAAQAIVPCPSVASVTRL